MGERPGPDGTGEYPRGDINSSVEQEDKAVLPEGAVEGAHHQGLDQVIRDFEHRDELRTEIARLQEQIDELKFREIQIEDIVEVVDGIPVSRSLYRYDNLTDNVEDADKIIYNLQFTGTGQPATVRVDNEGAVRVEFGSGEDKEIKEFGKGSEVKAAAIEAARDWVVVNG